MADSNGDIKDKEEEKVSEGEKGELSNSEQPTTSTEESQSAEQGQPVESEKETSTEQPTDTETKGEGKETQEERGTEAQSISREGEKGEGEEGVQEREEGATEESNDKPSDTEEQSAGNEATTTEDGQKAEVGTEESKETSSEGEQVPREGEEREGERDGEKLKEPSLDEQRKDDQVEGGGEAAKSDEQAVIEGESSVKDTEQQAEAGQQLDQQGEEGETAEEGAKVKEEKSVPTGEESEVMGMGVLNEPLADILEEDEEQEPIDREELLAASKEVLLEQERLRSVSAQLQHKIAEYLAKKKTEERPDPGRNVTDQEKRYNQCMAALEMYESDLDTMQQRAELQDAQLLTLREQKLAEVRKAAEELAEYKKSIATTAVHSRTGRRLQAQEVEQFQAAEDKKESELTLVRLENIKLQNKISKLESQIKEKEQLAEGLHMIDFEQLKINNVDLNEKIEERNEDILKLRKKVTSTVQVLTHVKEKLQFLQVENGEKRAALRSIDEIVAKKRDHLTRMKQARDALRIDNNRLKQKGGLVSHPALLGDFEERKDQNDELRVVLEKLQQRHSELTVASDGFRKKVEQAKTIHPRNL